MKQFLQVQHNNDLASKSAKHSAKKLSPLNGKKESRLSWLQGIQIMLNYALMFVHLLVQRCVYLIFACVSS